MPLIRDC